MLIYKNDIINIFNIKYNMSKSNNETELKKIFDNCLNILRDNEGLTGEKALINMSYFLILKLIEPRLDNEIDIDNYEYDFDDFDDVEEDKKKLLKLVRFSNLKNEKEDNLKTNIGYVWNYVLAENPKTNKIFLKGKCFDIEYQSTYKRIIKKLGDLDLSKTKYDVLGEAYEDVIKDIMVGKVLGQFFTPPSVKKLMIQLIKPKIYEDGKIDTCCDPTMGTGGFLIEYLKEISKQATEKKIRPDWEFIKTEGLYGKEIEPVTYQLAVSNMLISSGHMFEELERGDSIREPIDKKFDNILANPPFGIKGLKYDDFHSLLKMEYVPIKTDNAVSLFIQAIIHILKIDGKCAVVLPDGQEISSKTNKKFISVREYLMKTCDLQEIIYLPSGIFSNTSIKTCIFYFIKKVEGKEILETKIKVSKTQKETGRDYKFIKECETSKITFYEYISEEDKKNLLIEVPIEKIVKKSYSLNYTEYIEEEKEEYDEGIVVKTLGEVCSIIKGEKKRSKDGKEKGLYPLYYCSILGNLYLDTFDYIGEGIIINKTNGSGKAMVYYGSKKYNVGETTIHFKSKLNELETKYIYYYLLHNIELVQKYFKGANQKSIVEDDLFKITIPIPLLERQKEIVKYLDFIYEKANKTSNDKIAELKQLNEFCLNNQKMFGENVVKKLGEISVINPENMKSGQYTEINYIDISSVKGGQILELQKLTNDFPSRAKRIVKKGDILYSSVRPNLKGYVYISDNIQNGIASTGFADIRVKEPNTILSKYLYYIMTSDYISDYLIRKAKGAQYPAVSFDDFETIKIPIPSLEIQKEIVEYCEKNEKLIQQLEQEIENNKKEAEKFMKNVIKLKKRRNNK